MYTVNTHDSLMGQNTFVANSNIKTVNDFNKAFNAIMNNIILANDDFVTDYGIDENDEPNTVLSNFIDFMRDEELDIPELNNVRDAMDDFDGVNTIDVDDMAGVLGVDGETSKIVSLDGEFAFMYNLSSVGDDALCLVASILYFDEDMNLCIYVPTCGNTRIPDTNYVLGNNDEYDDDVISDLIQKHTAYINSEKQKYSTKNRDSLQCYLAYKAEFGIISDGKNEWHGSCWECDVVPNEDLIMKDIKSNVQMH